MRSLACQPRLFSLFHTSFAIAATIVATGCGGGGCSSGCAGSQVIPKGFPAEGRVPNSAGVRVTRAGLDFLEANLSSVITKVLAGGGGKVTGGIMTFEVPESTGSVKNPIPFLPDIKYTICPGGPKPTEDPPKCVVEINIGKIHDVKMASQTPHDLSIDAVVPIRLRNLPLIVAGINTTAGLGVGAASDCGALDFVDVTINADVALENIPDDATHHARAGYTKINIAKMTFNDQPVKDNFKFCGSGIGTDILNLIKPLIVGFISGGLTSKLSGPLQNATCMKAQVLPDKTTQCPEGTSDVSGTCRYGADAASECVPMLLGLESRFDLSGLLASLSPGTSGGLDFLLGSGGDMNPAPGTDPTQNGITLNMLGGGNPFPISHCVPQAPNPIPTGIQIPDELQANTVTPWTSPTPEHLGFGIAERFLNHAATAAYNSGLFCIGISSEQIPQLDAGLFKVLLPSIDQLADKFNAGDSHPSMGLSIRPQKPPQITVGDNSDDFKSPLLDLKLKDTDLDFYMWSENRFIRLFTGRIDIEVPLNLEATKDGLAIKLPAKNPLSFTNARVSNNGLLTESDAKVANLVQSLGGLIPATALSNIKPFKLDAALASLGLTLNIPKEGIRKLTKGSDRFLAIFASLQVATSAMPTTRTAAKITTFTVDPTSYTKLETFGDHPAEIWVHAQADLDDGSHAVEYSYKVDHGPWSMFAPGRDFQVSSPVLKFQGKHVISVTSRVADLVQSEGEPVDLPLVIDVQPPTVKVQSGEPGYVRVLASDLVCAPHDLRVEVRLDGGEWTPVPVEAAVRDKVVDQVVKVGDGSVLDVRVTDESGNVGQSSTPLLRGRADSAIPGKAGCGCSVPGPTDTTTGAGAIAGSLALLGAVLERRRRRARAVRGAALGSMLVLGAGASGCTCAGGSGDSANTDAGDNRPEIVTYVLGSYMSAKATSDGKIWVAGYHEGDPSTGSSNDFKGDLVVGKWDDAKQKVGWVVVDGIPDVPATMSASGFRKGITDPGDDVGLYTSMALSSAGNPIVAYHDRTNGSLRVAVYDGNSWTSHEVDTQPKGWAGRFTSTVLAGGKPAVAYQSLEPGTNGFAKVRVRLATASSETPASKSDWTLSDIAVDDKAPCIQDVCASGQKCLAGDVTTGVDAACTTTISGCDATCADACIKNPKDGKPLCAKQKAQVTGFVNAIGNYISLAASSSGTLGVVFYDRAHGNLRGGSLTGGKWTVTPATAPIDGWVGDAAKDKGLGDRGIGASLAIDASGNWHVSYVDGIKEQLLYKFIAGGDPSKAGAVAPVIVDDGASADGGATKFADGQHLVGDDSNLAVDGTTIRIVYQDATDGTLRWAKATAAGATPKFTRGALKQDGFAGFFPKIVGNQVLDFYRMKGTTQGDTEAGIPGDPVILGDVRAVALP